MSLVDPQIYNKIYDHIAPTNNDLNVDITFKNLKWNNIIVNLIIPILMLLILAFFLKARYRQYNIQKDYDLLSHESEDYWIT